MILRNEEECYIEGEAQRSGDDWGVEATGSGTEGGGGVPRLELDNGDSLGIAAVF